MEHALSLLGGIFPLFVYGLIAYWLVRKFVTRRGGGTQFSDRPTRNADNETSAAKDHPRRLGMIAQPVDRGAPHGSEAGNDALFRINPAPAAPLEISETVSVVLRRQIPPRFDAPSRSWLGGLPHMPADIAWPTSVSSEYPDRGKRPLHFLAQICCADLPVDLWGGHGPRHGWLLLFIDPNIGVPEENDAFCILHLAAQGVERQPPVDLGPVHDGVYTGPDYRYLRPGEAVPSVWRKWPIDIVTVRNDARQEEGRVVVSPENFASILYDGANVAPDGSRPEAMQPFTYGQALYALGALQRIVDFAPGPRKLSQRFVEFFRKYGQLRAVIDTCADQIAALEKNLAALQENAAAAPAAERAAMKGREQLVAGRMESQRLLVQWLQNFANEDAMLRYFETVPASRKAWADAFRPKLVAAQTALEMHPADAALSDAAWHDLVEQLAGNDFVHWSDGPISTYDGRPPIPFNEITISTTIAPPAAMPRLIADAYVDERRHGHIPHGVRADYEPFWRQLYSNRPHRMGGYHDGLQSDAVIGPSTRLLLLQIATDDAMDWCWGDAGAYYFWITPQALDTCDFSSVEIILECH